MKPWSWKSSAVLRKGGDTNEKLLTQLTITYRVNTSLLSIFTFRGEPRGALVALCGRVVLAVAALREPGD